MAGDWSSPRKSLSTRTLFRAPVAAPVAIFGHLVNFWDQFPFSDVNWKMRDSYNIQKGRSWAGLCCDITTSLPWSKSGITCVQFFTLPILFLFLQ